MAKRAPASWPIERLIPRGTHSRAQVASIAASMREWGWTNPILVSADDDLIAGRARLLAADKLGTKEVSVIVLRRLSPGAIRSQEPATCGSLEIALNLRSSGA